jgi:hypothetical protein
MAPDPPPLSPEDEALLERLATRVVELRMEVPAILALETAKPVNVIASQALIFFEPLIQSVFGFAGYRRFTTLIERRDVMESLLTRIEQGAERARARRAEARRTARAPRSSSSTDSSPRPDRRG